jgi:polysaccharide export outer membrane protein
MSQTKGPTMKIKTPHVLVFARKSGCTFLALGLLSAGFAAAQSNGPGKPGRDEISSMDQGDYKIGVGDVLAISVSDAPEFGGRFRVSESGLIELPGLSTAIRAEGNSPLELSHTVRQAFIDAKQLRDPRINVFVEDFRGSTITVLGAVAKPAVYPLQRKTTVLDALSMAGGALPNSGGTVTIVRGAASAEATGTAVGSVQIIDVSRLLKGEDVSANVRVQSGDVINVSAANIVYVVGAVTKPGGFAISDTNSGISVMQAVALAEGFKSVAATRTCLIIRQSTSDARKEIPVDIAQMMAGKGIDEVLAPNDILYVPESGAKKTLKVMGDIAMATADGLAVYAVGYRIGTRP